MNDQEYAIETKKALDGIAAKLAESSGYFNWERVEDALFRRNPKTGPDAPKWLAGEKPKLVHICHPVPLAEAIEAGSKDRTVAHSSYVSPYEEAVKCAGTANLKPYDGLRCIRCGYETEVTA